jgi:peptidoglycan/LPS O-acetylase OafA/YrhL
LALAGAGERSPGREPPTEAPRAASFDDTRSKNISYLIGVDHLRCAAALLVLYYHGIQLFSSHVRYQRMFLPADWRTAPDPFSALLAEGHTAVALFITLSGFIFSFGAAGRHITYPQFLGNRFLRTYPLMLLVVMTGTAIHQKSVSLWPLLQLLLGGANLNGAQWLGDFSAMLWSVSLEWQLYALFPALMAILNRSGPGHMLMAIALLLATRLLAYQLGLNPVHGLYTQVLGRLDQFGLGMIAGYIFARHRHHPRLAQLLVPGVALALAGAYAFNQLGGWPAVAWWKIFTPLLEGIVWAAVTLGYLSWLDRRRGRAGWAARAAAAVGATSYSIYLWHFVLIQAQRRLDWVPRLIEQPELNAALLVTLTTLPVTLAFAACSYHVVEKPFMSLRRRYVQNEQAAVAACP